MDYLINYFRENPAEWNSFKKSVEQVDNILSVNDVDEMIKNTTGNRFGKYLYKEQSINILLRHSLKGDHVAQYYLYDKLMKLAQGLDGKAKVETIKSAMIFLIVSGIYGNYNDSKLNLFEMLGESKLSKLNENKPKSCNDIMNFLAESVNDT